MSGRTLLWIGCSGETQALLGVEGQVSDLLDLIDVDGLRLLWHPSLAECDLRPVHQALMDGRERLTVLCVEGSVALAEDGMFDMADGTGKFRLVAPLCELADYVLAMGACAGYGGWQAKPPNPSGARGRLHHHRARLVRQMGRRTPLRPLPFPIQAAASRCFP
jgi:uptake hydrogenase small subunit